MNKILLLIIILFTSHCSYTPIYKNDTLIELANRHYELEIETLSNFLYHIKNPKPLKCEIKNAKMRMPFDKEEEMIKRFEDYKHKFGE